MTEPAAALFGVPAHLETGDRRCSSWILEPAGMLNQIAPGSILDGQLARFITTTVDAEMRRRFPPPRKYVYIHDFSGLASIDGAARDHLIDFGRRTGKREVERIFLLAPESAVFRAAAAAAVLALRVVGIHMEMVPSLATIVRERGIKPAA